MRYEWICEEWPEYAIIITRSVEERDIPPNEEELIGEGLKPDSKYVRALSVPLNRWRYHD